MISSLEHGRFLKEIEYIMQRETLMNLINMIHFYNFYMLKDKPLIKRLILISILNHSHIMISLMSQNLFNNVSISYNLKKIHRNKIICEKIISFIS